MAGVLAGPNEQAVLAELDARQLTPVLLQEQRESSGIRRGVSTRHLAMSYQQMADLIRAGVPLLRGLQLLSRRKSTPRLSRVYRDLAEAVADGQELCDAMASQPAVFTKVHVAMVRAGEKGGFLEDVLARLGDLLMRQAEIRNKIIGNMIYPCVLVVFGVAVLTVVFSVFVPMFKPMFEQIPRLPMMTRIVFAASAMVSRYAVVTVLVVGGGVVTLWRLSKKESVRHRLAVIRTRMPVLGPLSRSIATARFCRVLGTMLGNGIPVLTSMEIARDASGNILLERAVDRAAEAVRAGEPLSPPLSESKLFGDDVIEMIAVGESANNLHDVLITIAQTIEGRIDRLLTAAVRLIEPLLLLMLAGVIVVVAMGLLMPIMQLSGSLGS